MIDVFRPLTGLVALAESVPVPSMGHLSVNSYLVEAAEPYVVDTGLFAEGLAFLEEVEDLMDPADLRWIYLTHADPDHLGALVPLLTRAPHARIVSTFIGLAKVGVALGVPPDRFHLVNPGESLDLGDRRLHVRRPPLFDAPETTTMYDDALDVLFSSDAFGAPLAVPARYASEVPPASLREGELLWATVDAPWVRYVDRTWLKAALDAIDALDPTWILSSHLPPAGGLTQVLCDNVLHAPDAPPYRGPNQPELEALLASADQGPSVASAEMGSEGAMP